MLLALQALQAEFSFLVEVIDVDTDPALVALYDELVPVLMGSRTAISSEQLCHYYLNKTQSGNSCPSRQVDSGFPPSNPVKCGADQASVTKRSPGELPRSERFFCI